MGTVIMVLPVVVGSDRGGRFVVIVGGMGVVIVGVVVLVVVTVCS